MDLNRVDFDKVTVIDSGKKIGVKLSQSEIDFLSDKAFRRLNPVLLIVALKGYLDEESSEVYQTYIKRLKELWKQPSFPETFFEDYRIYKEKIKTRY